MNNTLLESVAEADILEHGRCFFLNHRHKNTSGWQTFMCLNGRRWGRAEGSLQKVARSLKKGHINLKRLKTALGCPTERDISGKSACARKAKSPWSQALCTHSPNNDLKWQNFWRQLQGMAFGPSLEGLGLHFFGSPGPREDCLQASLNLKPILFQAAEGRKKEVQTCKWTMGKCKASSISMWV